MQKTAVKYYKNRILKDVTYFNSKNEAEKFVKNEVKNFSDYQKKTNRINYIIE